MTSTLIDTNVLLDIVEMRLGWEEWSSRQVFEARLGGKIILNPIVYAEASIPYENAAEFDAIINDAGFVKEDLPWPAAFLAAKVHRRYRARGGVRAQTLPDFFIAAHAAVKSFKLVTRDAARFRTYFPRIDIIAPDTHP
jgi:hypothetical protein